MPQPIMIPQSYYPWQNALPNFVQMLARGMIMKQLQQREKEDWDIIKGEKEYWRVRPATGEKAELDIPVPRKGIEKEDNWEQLKPMKFGGALIYPQRNTRTGKVVYNRFPPKPEVAKGAEVARRSKEQQMLMNKQRATLNQINSELKAAGIKDLDVLELMALEGPAQMEYLKQQTKPMIERLSEPHKAKLRRLYQKAEDITLEIVGPLPSIPLSREMAEQLLNEAGGDLEKARQLAKERGYMF